MTAALLGRTSRTQGMDLSYPISDARAETATLFLCVYVLVCVCVNIRGFRILPQVQVQRLVKKLPALLPLQKLIQTGIWKGFRDEEREKSPSKCGFSDQGCTELSSSHREMHAMAWSLATMHTLSTRDYLQDCVHASWGPTWHCPTLAYPI